jgi:hypothetical protein
LICIFEYWEEDWAWSGTDGPSQRGRGGQDRKRVGRRKREEARKEMDSGDGGLFLELWMDDICDAEGQTTSIG